MCPSLSTDHMFDSGTYIVLPKQISITSVVGLISRIPKSKHAAELKLVQ